MNLACLCSREMFVCLKCNGVEAVSQIEGVTMPPPYPVCHAGAGWSRDNVLCTSTPSKDVRYEDIASKSKSSLLNDSGCYGHCGF